MLATSHSNKLCMGIFDFLKEFIHTTTAPHNNLNSGSLQTLLFWKKKKKKECIKLLWITLMWQNRTLSISGGVAQRWKTSDAYWIYMSSYLKGIREMREGNHPSSWVIYIKR